MNKNFKSVKASLIIGILLVSLSAAIVPSSSAAGIFKQTPYMQFIYDSKNADNIIPDNLNGSKIPITISYKIASMFAGLAVNRLKAQDVQINIQIGHDQLPSYCMASVKPQVIYVTPSIDFVEATTELKVTFTKNAPFPASVNIPIIVTASLAPAFPWSVETLTQTYFVTVSAGYIPIIGVTPDPKYLETSPGSIATFGIDCANIGNGETDFQFEVVDVPAGWNAQIVDSKYIPPNSKETLALQVRGPIGFGYHDETETITVKVRGIYYASDGTYTTETDKEFTVTVRSVGFYASAFDAMIIIFLLVALIIVVFFIIQWRKKGK